MKLRLLFLLSMIGLLSPCIRAEFTFEYEGNSLYYSVLDDTAKTCIVIRTNELKSPKLIIPMTVVDESDGCLYTVTEIGNKVFQGMSFSSIEIPNSVNKIGVRAFSNCSGFTQINIPNSVSAIEVEAFTGCKDLKEITLPESITNIGYSAFSVCQNLKSVHLPNSLTEISDGAFQYCTALESIEIPGSITSIGSGAFAFCMNLTSIKIPDSVTIIGPNAFHCCLSMKKADYSSLESLLSIEFVGSSANPLSQAHHLFINGEEITEIVIPDTVSTLKGTFFGGSYLTSIKIPQSVTSIGDYTFRDCSGLNEIDIPDQVTHIGEYAFAECSGLKEIRIPDKITTIEVCSFTGCDALTEISIPDNVTFIKSYAFSHCKELSKVRMPNSVGIISNGVFKGCNKLNTLILGSKVGSIGDEAFKECSVSNIYITAPNPPKAGNAFSDYSGTLHLQGEASSSAYGNNEVWGKFKRELMVEPTGLAIEGASYVSGTPGETFQLKAEISPADVTLPYIYWRSTNPRIATVSNNGLVTLLANEEEDKTRVEENDSSDKSCKIIAESLYYDGPIAEVTVFNSDFNDVETVIGNETEGGIDYSFPYVIYNLNGVKVGDSKNVLSSGIYIIRQNNCAKKITVN